MSLSELCVRRPVFATMLVMSLVVLGIFSFRDLGVDLFPKADPATVTVSVQLPGASPDEMATAVVEPLEEALSSISGIDEMPAQRISEGTRQHHPQVRARARHQRRRQRRPREGRRRACATCRRRCCRRSSRRSIPTRIRSCPSSLSSDTMSLRTLTEIADKQVKRAIETVNGVGQVDLGGGRAREIHIVVDIEKLNALRAVDRARQRGHRRREHRDAGRHASSRARPRFCCARSGASTPPRSSTTSSSRR